MMRKRRLVFVLGWKGGLPNQVEIDVQTYLMIFCPE